MCCATMRVHTEGFSSLGGMPWLWELLESSWCLMDMGIERWFNKGWILSGDTNSLQFSFLTLFFKVLRAWCDVTDPQLLPDPTTPFCGSSHSGLYVILAWTWTHCSFFLGCSPPQAPLPDTLPTSLGGASSFGGALPHHFSNPQPWFAAPHQPCFV